jgi:hypothetical protein
MKSAPDWRKRVYISDHQSTGERDGIDKQMILRPRNVSTVHLPDGTSVSFRSGKCSSKVGKDVVSKAEKAYDEWMKRVLLDFPLGAFASPVKDRPVFLEAYPIVDGPAGAGEMNYFLLDVSADGQYELDTNNSDEYGEEHKVQDKKVAGKLTLCRKTAKGRLPVGFDEKLNGYRVLPETLKNSFACEQKDVTLPLQLSLKKGRYLISIKPPQGRPLSKIRVAPRQGPER